MKLFYYKPKQYSPLLFLVTKISSESELEKLEAWANELFQILIDQKEASEINILVFSVIKDYDRKTINLIKPSTKSSPTLSNRCFEDTKFVNSVVVDTLKKCDSDFHLEVLSDKVVIHQTKLNLMSLCRFYSV